MAPGLLHWNFFAPYIVLWTALLLSRSPSPSPPSNKTCCGVVELRQYTLYPGKRDVLIDLFEREFIESQEALGAQVVGQFRDLDNPNRFVWIRGFRDMSSRLDALQGFYGGPVWKAHREEANATMEDSSNVLLLRSADAASEFVTPSTPRPPVGSTERVRSLMVATIYYLQVPADDAFITFFEHEVAPLMTVTGAQPLASFQSETAENNFPRLPVRTGENVFVWFARFKNPDEYADHLHRLEHAKSWTKNVQPRLASYFKSSPQYLRLEPTPRSLLR
jgi:quinol monooxygenase YgiN